MYSFLHDILCDKKSGEVFKLFSTWHFLYIALTLMAIAALIFITKNKGAKNKEKATRHLIYTAFGLYIADFFLMPLAYNEIDIEKLPFHACTAMCVTCFLSYKIPLLEKHRTSFVLLGFISNLVYLIYPAGVMWHAVHPLSYRVIQTLIFHSIMTVYGFLYLFYHNTDIDIRKCHKDLAVIVGMTVWALIGNYAYNGTSQGYSHFFNWFFVVRDPFYAIPESISPFVMPFLNVAVFFGVEIMVHCIIILIKKLPYDKNDLSPENRRNPTQIAKHCKTRSDIMENMNEKHENNQHAHKGK